MAIVQRSRVQCIVCFGHSPLLTIDFILHYGRMLLKSNTLQSVEDELTHVTVCTFLINVAKNVSIKEALYRIWCGANRLGDSGVHTLDNNSAVIYVTKSRTGNYDFRACARARGFPGSTLFGRTHTLRRVCRAITR